MQERMGEGGAGQAYGGLYGPAQAWVGGLPPGGGAPGQGQGVVGQGVLGQPGQCAAAMSGLPPGSAGLGANPGLIPPPQIAPAPGTEPLPDDLRRRLGEPESLPIDPQAGRGSTVSTPIPEPVRGSNVLPGTTIGGQFLPNVWEMASATKGQSSTSNTGGASNTGPTPYNVDTTGLSAAEVAAIIEYTQEANRWLSANGPVIIQATSGMLRSQANAAARSERRRAAAAGTPYQGKAGHVPDTAVTGRPHPPAGWLDMPGKSNEVVGGGLSSRIGKTISVITVDGKIP